MHNSKLVVLVTGAAGFAAEHLIPRLKENNYFVIGLDRKAAPSASVDLYKKADLLNINDNDNIFEDLEIDLVIHLAAARADWGVSDAEFNRDNYLATKALLKYCENKQINKFIFVSSISVMPQNSYSPISEQSPNAPINAYGRSKEAAENALIEHTKKITKFCLTIIRPAVLYGPSDPNNTGIYRAIDNNIFRLIDAIYKKRFAFIGDINTPKTTAYIENFVDAILFCLAQKPGYEIYIYCDEPALETGSLVKLIRSKFNRSGLGLRLPMTGALVIASLFDYLGQKLNINFPITKARIQTFNRPTNFRRDALNRKGFQQKINNEDAMHKTIDWYLDLNKKNIFNTFFVRHDDTKE